MHGRGADVWVCRLHRAMLYTDREMCRKVFAEHESAVAKFGYSFHNLSQVLVTDLVRPFLMAVDD